MAKFANDLNADVLLDRIRSEGKRVLLLETEPSTFKDAITALGSTVAGLSTTILGKLIGDSTLSTASFTGPTTAATDGRKMQINQVTGLSIDVTSTGAQHVAIVTTTTATELMFVTTITSPQPVTSGNTATINAFNYTVRDVT